MSTLYWFTRLASLGEMCTGLLICCIIAMVFLFVMSPMIIDMYNDFEEGKRSTYRKIFRFYILLLCLSILGTLFIPSKKELLFIYGVGNTIDYIKSNPTAKQLPDKYINALDAWVDTWVEKPDSINSKK